MKKFFAILLSIALLCALCACGETAKKPASTQPAEAAVCGMLVLTTETAVKITYDTDGMVTDVADAENYTDFLGKSCSTVVKELMESHKLSPDVKNIVLKVSVGSQLPTQFFLEALTTDLENAAKALETSAKITVIGLDSLDESGFIKAETAESLLRNQLGNTIEKLVANDILINEAYSFTVTTTDGEIQVYNVDAVTGLIFIADTAEDVGNENIQETTAAQTEPTEAVTEPIEETIPEEIPEDTVPADTTPDEPLIDA